MTEDVNSKKIRYTHKRPEEGEDYMIVKGEGGNIKASAVTTAYICEEDKDGKPLENAKILAEAEAVCSVKDQFCKKLGRRIANGRLLKSLNNS